MVRTVFIFIIKSILVSVAIVSLYSCHSLSTDKYSGIETFDNFLWSQAQWANFEYLNTVDSSLNAPVDKKLEISLFLRYKQFVNVPTIPLEVKCVDPNGYFHSDTIYVSLVASPNQTHSSNIKAQYLETEMLFRENVTFARSGRYLFSIRHLLNDSTIEGIQAIGLNIDQK